MPAAIERALDGAGWMARYRKRPAYQQNDCLSWIGRAIRPETKRKRIRIMLDDLRRGDRYMGMLYNSGRKRRGA